MASDKQISELTAANITSNNDCFMFDDAEGYTYKINYSALASAILQTSLGAGTGISITQDTSASIFKMNIASTVEGSRWYYGTSRPQNAGNGDYWIDTTSGQNLSVYQYNGSTWVDTGMDLKGADGTNGQNGQDGADGYSISATTTTITGGHRVTIHSTDPNVPDTYFDVMDGSGGGGGSSWIESIPEMHRNIYRGQSLGTVPSATQKLAVTSGTFDDIYIGDYWQPDANTKLVVADMNYYLGTGAQGYDQQFNTPHLVLLVIQTGATVQLYQTDQEQMPTYELTDWYENTKPTIESTLETLLGATTIIERRVGYDGGLYAPVGYGNSKIDILNQLLVFGTKVCPTLQEFESEHQQLSLFRLRPAAITEYMSNAVLRDVWKNLDDPQSTMTYLVNVGTSFNDNMVQPMTTDYTGKLVTYLAYSGLSS